MKNNRLSSIWTTAIALAAMPVTGFAQTAPDTKSDSIEEIVVTAQKRSESIQKVPLAITALSAEALADAGVKSGADLSNLQPGLTVSSFGPSVNISLRGVQNEVFNSFGESDIAYNLDGVFEGRSISANGAFYDMARVEILKGPQGTLYGRNATAGAINIITNTPTDKYEGALELQGGNFGLIQSQGMINIPINETLALRGAFSTINHDGYLSDGSSDADSIAGRLKLLWTPNEDVRVLVQGDYNHDGGRGSSTVPTNPDGSYLTSNPYYRPTILPDALAGNLPVAVSGPTKQDNRIWGVQIQADWDFHWATLTVLPAYRETHANYTDFQGGFLDVEDNYDKQVSVEARLTSDSQPHDRFKWVAGLYYFGETQPHYNTVEIAYPGTTFPGSPAVMSNQDAPSVPSRSYAAFAQGTYSIVDWLRLTLGARDTHDVKSVTGDQYFHFAAPGTLIPAGPILPGTLFQYQYHQSTRAFNYKAGLDADITPDSLVYASISTGYKAGGFFAVAPTPIPGIFQPEKLTAYSVGTKNQFLDKRLQLNAEAFYWDYTDYQYASIFSDGGNISYGVFNLPAAVIDGIDLDADYRLTSSDRFSGSVEYLHTNTGKAILPGLAGPVDVSQENFPNAPKWSLHLSYQHVWDFADGATVVGQIMTSISTKQRLSLGSTPAGLIEGGYSSTGANLTYNAASGHWYAGVWVKNLEDDAVRNIGSLGFTQYVFSNVYPPRTFGVKVGVTF